MKSWFLLYCKRGQINRAQEHLHRQSVVTLNPLCLCEKMVRGKRTRVNEPLFPNYLFIQFDPEVIHTTTINATRGVNHFVRFGLYPAKVPEPVITTLLDEEKINIVDPQLPQAGDEVLITAGPLQGISAIFSEPDGETRSILLLNLLNNKISKEVNNQLFKKI